MASRADCAARPITTPEQRAILAAERDAQRCGTQSSAREVLSFLRRRLAVCTPELRDELRTITEDAERIFG